MKIKQQAKETTILNHVYKKPYTYHFQILKNSHIQTKCTICSRNKLTREQGRRKIKGINYTYKQKPAGKRLVFQISKGICERKRNCASGSSHSLQGLLPFFTKLTVCNSCFFFFSLKCPTVYWSIPLNVEK